MYIATNPVAAGMCGSPEDWPWSSHGAMVARDEAAWLRPQRLLDVLGAAGGNPRRRYAELVG